MSRFCRQVRSWEDAVEWMGSSNSVVVLICMLGFLSPTPEPTRSGPIVAINPQYKDTLVSREILQ